MFLKKREIVACFERKLKYGEWNGWKEVRKSLHEPFSCGFSIIFRQSLIISGGKFGNTEI